MENITADVRQRRRWEGALHGSLRLPVGVLLCDNIFVAQITLKEVVLVLSERAMNVPQQYHIVDTSNMVTLMQGLNADFNEKFRVLLAETQSRYVSTQCFQSAANCISALQSWVLAQHGTDGDIGRTGATHTMCRASGICTRLSDTMLTFDAVLWMA